MDSQPHDNFTFDEQDLVYYTDPENNIFSGGYQVSSVLMKAGLSPMSSNVQEGGAGLDDGQQEPELFHHLVLPNWALYHPQSHKQLTHKTRDGGNAPDILMEWLLSMAEGITPQNHIPIINNTKRKKPSPQSKLTRRHKRH